MNTKIEKLKEYKNTLKENIKDNAVVNHVKSNQNVYIPIACIVGTLVVSHYWKNTQPGVVTNTLTTTASDGSSAISIVGDNNRLVVELARRGHPGFIVKDVKSGVALASKNQMMDYLGVTYDVLQKKIAAGEVEVLGLAR